MNKGLNKKTKIEAEKRRKEAVALVTSLKQSGCKVKDISKNVGISPVGLHYWEKKTFFPSATHLKKLKRFFSKVYRERSKQI